MANSHSSQYIYIIVFRYSVDHVKINFFLELGLGLTIFKGVLGIMNMPDKCLIVKTTRSHDDFVQPTLSPGEGKGQIECMHSGQRF